MDILECGNEKKNFKKKQISKSEAASLREGIQKINVIIPVENSSDFPSWWLQNCLGLAHTDSLNGSGGVPHHQVAMAMAHARAFRAQGSSAHCGWIEESGSGLGRWMMGMKEDSDQP